MPRLSTLSNPTGLVEIEKHRISILIDEGGKQLAFSLARLNVDDLHLSPKLKIVVIARRGNSEERLELGSLSEWDKSYRAVPELGHDGTWAFRVLLLEQGSAKLIASCENVRPDEQGDSSSFIALEPADLDQRPWEILVLEQLGRAVIRFNQKIYLSSGEAEADKYFIGLVLPEAIRQLSEWIATDAARLSDPAWEAFRAWLTLHGISDEPNDENPDDQKEWCGKVVNAFCNRFEFATQLQGLRAKGGDS